MWDNFKAMPTLLKFLTAHALACIVFVFASFFPSSSFRINNRYVTHTEWWSSGIGVYVVVVGVLMAFAGYLLISNNRFSRQIYLTVLLLGLVAPYLKVGEYAGALFGVFVTLMISAYLFHKPSAKEYFASNKRMQSDAATPRR